MLLWKYRDGAGEEAQQLRALTALVEDAVPCQVAHNYLLTAAQGGSKQLHTCARTHTHMKKKSHICNLNAGEVEAGPGVHHQPWLQWE